MLSSTITQVPAGANLQDYINSASTGDTLQLNGTYIGNFTENKGLVIEGPGTIATPNTQWAVYYPPKTPKATLRNLTVTVTVGGVNDIIRHGSEGAEQDSLDEVPQGLTLENVDVTGLPGLETKRGVTANGTNLVIRKSKIREIHGKGYDTQAVCGWNGPGPILIEDSYLEASGENVMFGGADPSIPGLIPSDITIRRNHFNKPLEWKGVWTVKNLLETKNARRVLVDGNLFENVWPDAQVGFAILLKSNNQDSTAPWSVTEDLVFSNNIIRNAEHGLNIMGFEYPPKVSGMTKRLRIVNNFWDVRKIWLQIIRGGEDVTLEHNTHLSADGNTATIGDPYEGGDVPTKALVLRNNLGMRSGYGFKGDGVGEGTATLNRWATAWIYQRNVLAGAQASVYPADNFYPATLNEIGFVDLANKDYRLAPSSPYRGKGTDGKDPGVDWDALNAAQSGATPTPLPTQSMSPSPSVTSTPTPIATATATVTPTATSTPTPPLASPTVTPTPTPAPTQTPRPSPTLPVCRSGQIVGVPPVCRCLTGMRGSSGKCR